MNLSPTKLLSVLVLAIGVGIAGYLLIGQNFKIVTPSFFKNTPKPKENVAKINFSRNLSSGALDDQIVCRSEKVSDYRWEDLDGDGLEELIDNCRIVYVHSDDKFVGIGLYNEAASKTVCSTPGNKACLWARIEPFQAKSGEYSISKDGSVVVWIAPGKPQKDQPNSLALGNRIVSFDKRSSLFREVPFQGVQGTLTKLKTIQWSEEGDSLLAGTLTLGESSCKYTTYEVGYPNGPTEELDSKTDACSNFEF